MISLIVSRKTRYELGLFLYRLVFETLDLPRESRWMSPGVESERKWRSRKTETGPSGLMRAPSVETPLFASWARISKHHTVAFICKHYAPYYTCDSRLNIIRRAETCVFFFRQEKIRSSTKTSLGWNPVVVTVGGGAPLLERLLVLAFMSLYLRSYYVVY